MNASQLFKNAPRFLTTRYGSLNRYVKETLAPVEKYDEIRHKYRDADKRKKEIKRLNEISEEASLVVFIFVLKKIFSDGSTAAKNAVDTFKGLNVEGFRVGSKFFSGRNDNVMQGDRLAEALLAAISSDRVRELVRSSNYLSEIIEEYQKLIDSGRQ